jgi:hypothetical protein
VFLFIKPGFPLVWSASSNREQRKIQRGTRLQVVAGATQDAHCFMCHYELEECVTVMSVHNIVPLTVTLGELINMCKMESEFISTFRKA